MSVYISDSLTGIPAAASIVGRTLDNSLGGAATAQWESKGETFVGKTGGVGFSSSGSDNRVNLGSLSGVKKARIKFDPGADTDNNLFIFGHSNADSSNTLGVLLVGYSSLRVCSVNVGARTDLATLGISKPTGAFWIEIEVNDSAKTLTGRILNEDTSVRNEVSHTFTTVPIGGDNWGIAGYFGNVNGTFSDFVVDVAGGGAPGDTTEPTLSAVSATATGTTTVSGSVTTTEAGPAWAVLTTAATTPTAAQIKAGQNSAGAASPAATATLAPGANSAAFSFTGLTPATGYYLHITQDDTATPANTATPVTAAMVTTSAPVVITLPALKNNTGTLLANEVGATVHVYAVATGNKVVTKTAQTSDASGVMAVTDADLVAATEYRCVIVLASGAEGLQKATAA